jgi:hypothetical protein
MYQYTGVNMSMLTLCWSRDPVMQYKVLCLLYAYHTNKVCVVCLPMCGMILMHYLYDTWHVFHRKVACLTHDTKIWWKFDRIRDTLMWITSLKHQPLRELLDRATSIYNAFCDWYVLYSVRSVVEKNQCSEHFSLGSDFNSIVLQA